MSIRSKIQACKDIFFNELVRNKSPFEVFTIEETIGKIIAHQLSVSRYGDGEVFMMANQMNDSFQTYDNAFAKKLIEVARSHTSNHIVCIPDIFEDLSKYTDKANEWFKWFLKRKKYLFYRYFDEKRVYGNAFITRPYIDLKDKSVSPHYYEALKKIWDNKDCLIVEGRFSRLGVGNDLFENTKSIKRILCPETNAYKQYDKILQTVKEVGDNKLILVALGATATALAYDLAVEGYWAIDIGHIDVEYEWMLVGATEKIPLKSKYVNEAKGGWCCEKIDNEKYISEIVACVGLNE